MLEVCLEWIYNGHCTWDSELDRRSKQMRPGGHRFVYLLVEVDIYTQDIVVGGVAFLPV